MICNKNLTILAIVAVLLLTWAIVLSTKDKPTASTSTAPAYLIQGLDPKTIATIVLNSEAGSSTLVRNGHEFTIKEKSDYPADTAAIDALITICLDIHRDEQITDNPDNYADLGITDEAPHTSILFQDAEGKDITGIFIGKTNVDAGGSYVRQTGNNAVYVSRNVSYLRTSADDYLNTTLTAVATDTITKVMIVDGDASYTLRKDENNIVMDLLPEGKQIKISDVESVFSALENLEFTDVSSDVAGLIFSRTYICELQDSTVYTIKIAQKADKTYITCSATFTDINQVTINPKAKDSPEELKAKEILLLANADTQIFTQKHVGWVYELASRQAENLTKTRTDLLEAILEIIETPETAETNQQSGQPHLNSFSI